MTKALFKDTPLLAFINGMLFYIAWFVLVDAAARDAELFGLSLAGMILIIKIALSRCRIADCILVGTAILIGLVADTLYIKAGILSFDSPNRIATDMAPWWILAIYGLFAATLNHGLRWMRRRPILSGVMGAVGGPMSYLAGIKWGAAESSVPLINLFMVIGVVWAVLMPVLFYYATSIDRYLSHKD